MGKCNNYTPDIQAQGDCIQCGCAFEDHEAKKEDKSQPEATTAPDYNNGDWWGWNGGECPVDTRSKVDVVFGGQTEQPYYNHFAANVFWEIGAGPSDIIAFRVTKPYVETSGPIETKTAAWRGNLTGNIYSSEQHYKCIKGTMTTTTQDGKCIRVVWEPCDG